MAGDTPLLLGSPQRDQSASTRKWELGLAYPSIKPNKDTYILAPGGLGVTSAAYTSTTMGREYFFPFLITQSWACAGPSYTISTGVSGGTANTLLIGLYPADPATGFPDTSQLLASMSTTTLSAATVAGVWGGGEITLNPHMYWIGTLYTNTAAPTTYPSLSVWNNVSWHLGQLKTNAISVSRGLYIGSLTALKNTATVGTDYTSTGANDCPAIGLRRSATN